MRPARFSNPVQDMSRVLVQALAVAAALVLAMPGGVRADEAASTELPRCEPATLGATACMGGISCECVQVRGGSISGELSGVKWNCDALRPRCTDGVAGNDGGVPATIPYTEFPYPHSVGIDRSEETTIIRQNQTANPRNTNTNTNN